MKYLTLFIISLILSSTQAGYHYQYWLTSDACSGNPSFEYAAGNDNECGSDNSGNEYHKITYEAGADKWHLHTYENKECTKQKNERIIARKDVDKCLIQSIFTSDKLSISFVCFPADSTVQLESGKDVKLYDLKVGQSIAAYDTATSKSIFSEVYTFLDYDRNVTEEFIQLFFENENNVVESISLTPEHLILAQRFINKPEVFVQAKDIRVGDTIFRSSNGKIDPVSISSIKTRRAKGIIAPATLDGTLVVNNIVASSYATIDHHISHKVLAPLRLAYYVSPKLANPQFRGMHPYTKWFHDVFFYYIMNPMPIYASATLDVQS